MKLPSLESPIDNLSKARLDRRNFLRKAGVFGLGAAASGIVLASGSPAMAQQESQGEQVQDYSQDRDTIMEIAMAALIAEDLATTFYYNGLTMPVIQSSQLAGMDGTAMNVTASGNAGNVMYLRAALSEEINHANLFRSFLNIPNPSKDPVQTFYFPAGTFMTLPAFTAMLNTLENAFIAAYINAIQEIARLANRAKDTHTYTNDNSPHPSETLDYYAKVVATILGVECEHRVLGRVISNSNPANNWNYEQLGTINAVYNGPNSAVAALAPFLNPSTGPAHSFAMAIENQASVSITVMGAAPLY